MRLYRLGLGLDANGKPTNNWEPLLEEVFRTVSKKTEDGTKYDVPPLWGGMLHLV